MTLAVLTGVVGAPSETFVARHIAELRPGQTVVIGRRTAADATWAPPDRPVLLIDALADAWWGDRERRALRETLDEHAVDTVLAEFLDLWIGAVDVLRADGRRVVAHAHGYDVSQRLRDPWWRDAYRAWNDVDAVVTMSTCTRDRLVAIGLRDDLVHVVPYGVDVPDTPPARGPSAPVRCLAVGRLVAKKDPGATVEALRRAVDRGADVVLDIVGDGPLLEDVRATAVRHDLPVVFHGARPSSFVRASMLRADVFVQHSRLDPATGDEEGLPVAVLEAMAAALPVVSTRHAGIPEAVDDGATGLLVDEGDVDAMADAIVGLARDSERRQRLGLAGWRRARERFTSARECTELRALLDPGSNVR